MPLQLPKTAVVLQVGPVLEAMEDVLALLLRSLDGRVYVAVGRGLWDFTSKDIYDYVDSLQEGKENKVCQLELCRQLEVQVSCAG